MKKLVLTGLATEHHFSNGGGVPNLGQAQFFLVFNDGELRVPVSEEAATVVVTHQAKMQAGEDVTSLNDEEAPEEMEQGEPVVETYENGADEDGVDQI